MPSLANRKGKGPDIFRECSPSSMCHISHIKGHVSRFTCPISCVTFLCIFLKDKIVEPVGASLCQFVPPCLVKNVIRILKLVEAKINVKRFRAALKTVIDKQLHALINYHTDCRKNIVADISCCFTQLLKYDNRTNKIREKKTY